MRPAHAPGVAARGPGVDGPVMSPVLRALLLLAAVALVALVVRSAPGPEARAAGTAGPTAASRARTFTFDGVAPGDQLAVLDAVARARPEARRLVAAVAGLVRVRVGTAGPGAAGTTSSRPGGYDVVLDLGGVSAALGPRGIDRLVLHELGHVVDFALVPDALEARLDAEVPAGYGCAGGVGGSCAARPERFAETWAKWAMDDIGVALEIGYEVPPPSVALDTWGAPLAALARP